jgi:amidase
MVTAGGTQGAATDPHAHSAEIAALGSGELRALLGSGALSSTEVTEALLDRIEAVDHGGPQLRSVLCINEAALEEAAARDAERQAGQIRGPLHGIPILLKDNIDTAGQMGTTAGSYALQGWAPAQDAPLAAHLRDAGAVIIGKANLSQWANFRGRPSSSGWSAVGGQTLNPHALDRTPGGSSAGSGAGVAGGLAVLAVGTETDGSITCPAAACGIVGLKPTVGLISRTGIVPISSSQDTAGPMGRCVADVATMLSVMAQAPTDASDGRQAERPWPAASDTPDYSAALSADLSGTRIGLMRADATYGPATQAATQRAVEALEEAGATVIEVPLIVPSTEDEMLVLNAEFKAGLASYLSRRINGRAAAGLTDEPLVTDVGDVVRFTRDHDGELPGLFSLDLLESAAAALDLDDPAYLTARERNWRKTRAEGIDAVSDEHNLDALMRPAMPPAFTIDQVSGDHYKECGWSIPAIAGYPSIAVPSGIVNGLPVAMILFGRAWSEATIVHIAFGLEAQLGLDLRPAWRANSLLVP